MVIEHRLRPHRKSKKNKKAKSKRQKSKKVRKLPRNRPKKQAYRSDLKMDQPSRLKTNFGLKKSKVIRTTKRRSSDEWPSNNDPILIMNEYVHLGSASCISSLSGHPYTPSSPKFLPAINPPTNLPKFDDIL